MLAFMAGGDGGVMAEGDGSRVRRWIFSLKEEERQR